MLNRIAKRKIQKRIILSCADGLEKMDGIFIYGIGTLSPGSFIAGDDIIKPLLKDV